MSSLQEMRDYIYYSSRPFTSQQIVKDTGICYQTVKKYLQDFISQNYIRHIGIDKGKNVYIVTKTKSMGKSYQATKKHLTIDDIKEKHRRQLQKKQEEWKDSVELL